MTSTQKVASMLYLLKSTPSLNQKIMLSQLHILPPTIYDKINKWKLTPGAYCIKYIDGSVYFGSSNTVGVRLQNHISEDKRNGCQITALSILAVFDTAELAHELEIKLIRRFVPTGKLRNRQLYSKAGKSTYKTISVRQLAIDAGIEPATVYCRIRAGETVEEALTKKDRKTTVRIPYRGKMYSAPDLAALVDIPYATLMYRLRAGWDIERAVNEPIPPKQHKQTIKFPSKDKEANWRWVIGALQSIVGKSDPGSLKAQDTYIRALEILASED